MYVLGLIVVILMVSVGLGFVIFVHELGHFVVAKLCGVKCEKFYLGFDIAGLKLCKFKWGETEYGIGVLPLGGYVKMLGQEDNPAKLAEEIERAKQGDEGRGTGDGEETANAESSAPRPASSAPAYDPRSFLAKSVPQRMAIISAGVIMNVIFAFFMAVVAFGLGVEQLPCIIGVIFPGEPAWEADLHVGDEILEIAGKKMTQFRDLQTTISLGDIPEEGVRLLVRRAGVKEPFNINVKPDRSRGVFVIGVSNGLTTKLAEDRRTWMVRKRLAVLPGTPAAEANPPFKNGDQIISIDDVRIERYAQISEQLAQKPHEGVTVTVERATEDSGGKPTQETKRLRIPVAPNPMWTLGLVMEMEPISAVQKDSPAADAGILPGDRIRAIDGKPPMDPLMLPDAMRNRAGKPVELTVERGEAKTPLTLTMVARKPIQLALWGITDGPVSVDALGIAYHVGNRVQSVVPGSPAAQAGLAAGDLVVSATVIPPDKETLRKLGFDQSEDTIAFGETARNWPVLLGVLQVAAPGTTVELTYSRNDKEQSAKLTPVRSNDWFNPERGLRFEGMSFLRRAESTSEAIALGGRETLDSLTLVYRMLGALGSARVSARNLAGPVGIAKWAAASADEGWAKLLLFLTMLSANLAVLNILPIPVLDGGHLVFLLYEGVRGKPANERVQVVLTYIGLGLLLALLVWATCLDSGLISRR